MSLTTRPDCDACQIIWENYEQQPPCGTCFPGIHLYNEPIMELHRACDDQLLIGPAGAIGLNDIAINMAMDRYFEVEKSDRLWLSLEVRKLSAKILNIQRDKVESNGKNSN